MLMHEKACNIHVLSYCFKLYAQLSNEARPPGDKTFHAQKCYAHNVKIPFISMIESKIFFSSAF